MLRLLCIRSPIRTKSSISLLIHQLQSFSSNNDSTNNWKPRLDPLKPPITAKSSKSTSTTSKTTTTVLRKTFIDLYTPIVVQPYLYLARWDKPIGTLLLAWPCFWSTALSHGHSLAQLPESNTSMLLSTAGDPHLLALFATGSILMRGAGCTINDMWDSKYDAAVERTKSRPLASGQLTHLQAAGFCSVQLLGGLGVLVQLPHLETCFWLAMSSVPLVAVYPLMKRYVAVPQAFLGTTINWGIFMGWAATHGSNIVTIEAASVLLPYYIGCISWTILYDTLYAHQDTKDDKELKLQSSALYFGKDDTKRYLYALAATSTSCWMLGGYNVGYMEPYYYLGIVTAGTHLIWQVVTANLHDTTNLSTRFQSNSITGAIVFASCMIGNYTL